MNLNEALGILSKHGYKVKLINEIFGFGFNAEKVYEAACNFMKLINQINKAADEGDDPSNTGINIGKLGFYMNQLIKKYEYDQIDGMKSTYKEMTEKPNYLILGETEKIAGREEYLAKLGISVNAKRLGKEYRIAQLTLNVKKFGK